MKEKKVVKLHKNNIVKDIILSALIIFVTFIVVLLFSPLFNITTIEVEGNHRLMKNSVIDASGIGIGENILRLDKTSIKKSIMKLPSVESTIIRRKWPSTIMIFVKEREALAKIENFGTTITVDEKGLVVGAYSDNSIVDIPLIENIDVVSYGLNSSIETSDTKKVNNVLEVLKNFKKNDMLCIIEKVSVISDDMIIYFKSGHIANIGDLTNLEYKVKRLKASIGQEDAEKFYFDVSNINVYTISKPLWAFTGEKHDIEVIE